MSSAYGLKAFVGGVLAWCIWRLFAPLHPSYVTFYWSVVVCFVVPLTVALLWPDIAFAIGRRVMRIYQERKGWLVMRDLPVASRAAFREVRAEMRRRKAA
jgi:hypothetical protein